MSAIPGLVLASRNKLLRHNHNTVICNDISVIFFFYRFKFFTNPKDGSLYFYNEIKENLEVSSHM